MIRLFVGWDDRESVGSHVFLSSVLQNCSLPVSVTHLDKRAVAKMYGVDIAEGSNEFTFSRYLCAALCDFTGYFLFADGADMLCRADLADLWALREPGYPIKVVKHSYQTRNPRKYIGVRSMETDNEDYERKNWSSLFLGFAGNMAWRRVTPLWMSRQSKLDMLQLRFLEDEKIGELPVEWNWLADEYGPNPAAKLLHWTAGIPRFKHYEDAYHSDEWRAQLKRVNYATD